MGRFVAPLFGGQFRVVQQRILKDKHSKLRLELDAAVFEAILFNCAEKMPDYIYALYELDWHIYNGTSGIQLRLMNWCLPERMSTSI